MGTKAGLPKVRAVERAMALLRAFGPAASRLSLAELTRHTGLDKGTTRRLLQTLATAEFIEFDDNSKTYALGPGILLLVPGVGYGRDLRDIAAPVLARLAEQTRATSFIWTYFRGSALCLDRVKAPDLSIDTPWSAIGTQISLNCAGGPRVLLAYLSPQERAQVLAGPLPRHTALTATDPAALEAAATVIRQRGWEFAVDDYILGLSGLGVPVLDQTGALAASISITTLTPQFVMQDGKPRDLPLMLEAAAEIGARLQP
jgi:DNA-binding IclR family transcriptional regulator